MTSVHSNNSNWGVPQFVSLYYKLGMAASTIDTRSIIYASTNGDTFTWGQFHRKCGKDVALSEDRRVAKGGNPNCIAFSDCSVPNGFKFAVKILEKGTYFCLGIGVTTRRLDREPVPQNWSDIYGSDQCWRVRIENTGCEASHKRKEKGLPWKLDDSAGNTFGCSVSKNGDLHLYHSCGRDVGVAWKGLPTDKPLWGFVTLPGWKVETSYIIAKGHPRDFTGKSFHCVDRPPSVVQGRSAHQHVTRCAVYCPNQCDGCGKKMDVSEVDDHLASDNGCAFQVVECSNNCGHKAWRPYIAEHMKSECRLRCENCQYCSSVFAHEHIIGKHLKECPNYPRSCPNRCGTWGLTHSTVSVHQKMCPLEQVGCEYKGLGCAVVLPRKDIAEHVNFKCHLRHEKCPLMSTHDHEQLSRAHSEECPNSPLMCPNKCGAQGLTNGTVVAHQEVCPLQQVECEYRQFGCDVELLRKDIGKHMWTSMQDHFLLIKE